MEIAFKCELCSEEFNSRDKLNGHIEPQHEKVRDRKNKRNKCSLCEHQFSSEADLIRHMRTHTGERPFKCHVSKCGKTFKRESTLQDHVKLKHSDKRPLECDFPECRHTTKTASGLKHHKKLHTDEKPFPCLYSGCNFRAKTKSNLSWHVRNFHKESKAFACSKCNFKSKYAGNLTSHMIVHEGNENIPCPIDGCEYKGKNRISFKAHMRRHKTSLPCLVSGCGRDLSNKEALRNHVKLHNPSGRAFQCPLCFKNFQTLGQLQTHCAAHTNERPFQCGHCKHEAAARAHVKNHISRAHPAIEFPFVVHLPDDRECLHCKITLPSAEFVVHCKCHVEPRLENLTREPTYYLNYF